MKILPLILLLIPLSAHSEWTYDLTFDGDMTGGGTVTFYTLSGYCDDTGCRDTMDFTNSPTLDMMITSTLSGNIYDMWRHSSVSINDDDSHIAWGIDAVTEQLSFMDIGAFTGEGPPNGIPNQGHPENWQASLNGNLADGVTMEEVEQDGNFDSQWFRGTGQVQATLAPVPVPSLPSLNISFRTAGLWQRYGDAQWQQIHSASSNNMGSGDFDGDGEQDMAVSFGSAGLWIRWNDGEWEKIHSLPADQITVSDMDGSGEEDIIISFKPYGLYVYMNNSYWEKLHSLSPSGVSL